MRRFTATAQTLPIGYKTAQQACSNAMFDCDAAISDPAGLFFVQEHHHTISADASVERHISSSPRTASLIPVPTPTVSRSIFCPSNSNALTQFCSLGSQNIESNLTRLTNAGSILLAGFSGNSSLN